MKPVNVFRNMTFLLFLSVASLLLASCGGTPFWLPSAHKIEIQQGNLLTENQIKSISTGMPKEEVRALIGEPVSTVLFDTGRWDYAFTRGPVGSSVKARRFSVFFENNIVVKTENNFDTETGERPVKKSWYQKKLPTI